MRRFKSPLFTARRCLCERPLEKENASRNTAVLLKAHGNQRGGACSQSIPHSMLAAVRSRGGSPDALSSDLNARPMPDASPELPALLLASPPQDDPGSPTPAIAAGELS